MKKEKYKVGKEAFGLLSEGDITQCTIILTDEDSGISLAYFPKESKEESNSIGFVKKKGEFYVKHGKDDAYVNTDKKLEEIFMTKAGKEAMTLTRNAAKDDRWHGGIGEGLTWMGKRNIKDWAEEITEKLDTGI